MKDIEEQIEKMIKKRKKPVSIIGGLKIWFKFEDARRVLETISKHSSRTDTLHMDELEQTAHLYHLDFDLKSIDAGPEDNRVHTGKYRLSAREFYLDEGINALKEKNVKIHVETETGLPVYEEGEDPYPLPYSINKNDIIFSQDEEDWDLLVQYVKNIEIFKENT